MAPRSNPFEALERTFNRMSRQFEEAARAWEEGEALEFPIRGAQRMAVDVIERDDEYEVTVDVPGYDRDEIDVRIVGDRLRIEAEREEPPEETEGTYERRERTHTRRSRSVSIPDDIDPQDVSATVHDGVLTVTIPRAETEDPRTIEIESE